jgi:hypothetical protein
MTKLADELEALAEKATPGPWEMDAGGTYRREEAQTVMLGGPAAKPQRLFDTLNSDVAEIGYDGDEDGTHYFDCQGQDNFKLIETLVNNLPAIITALRDVERMRVALQAIDRHNDNPKRYDSYINDQVRAALEPKQ